MSLHRSPTPSLYIIRRHFHFYLHEHKSNMQTSTRSLVSLLELFLIFLVHVTRCSPPEEPVKCLSANNTNCTIINSCGTFPDRTTCHAAMAVYPNSEEELLKAVSMAAKTKTKMKVATRYSHGIPKLACPGGEKGLIISTRNLNRVVSVDVKAMTMTVESGMVLKDFIPAAAKAGLALPYTPYWSGLTIGGMLATGAHGSSLWGKGSAVHEFVVGVRIVMPASGEEGFARVLSLDASHPEFDAVVVSLGVLGVISQVTLKLEPMFKRSLTYQDSDDTGLENMVIDFGKKYEFGDVSWYPGHKKVVFRIDFRVPTNETGNGLNDYSVFRSTATAELEVKRLTEENLEATSDRDGKCRTSKQLKDTLSSGGYGLKNNGILFTGYPVVGFQNRMQSSGSCLDSIEDSLITACPWDPRIKGNFFHQTTFSIALTKVKDFIIDVQKLRDMNTKAFCELEINIGILMRYVKGSTAFLGKEEDSVDFDIIYYRSHDPMEPRLDEDVFEEIEQMGLFKYGGLPHWGKNRNLAFDGVAKKYAKSGEFLKVKERFDPDGLFSSEWSDEVLGINGKRTSIFKQGCALEGLCICSEDSHCAPAKGYFCRPGKVFTDARVCSKVK